MKRKGFKTILTLCMVLAMLFGNVLTVSATETIEETTEELADTNIFYEAQEPDEEGKYHYIYNVLITMNPDTGAYQRFRGEITSKTPLAMYIGEEYERNGYTYLPYSIVNAPDMTMLLNTTYGGVEYGYTYENAFQTTKTDVGDITTVEKFQYTWNVNTTSGWQGGVGTNIPIFSSKESAWNYLETMDDSAVTNKKKADLNTAEFDENLDFINLRYQELSGTPRSHSISWDTNSAYDENTYVKIETDIKWRPILGSLNTVSAWEWVSISDRYPATNNNYTCLVTEPWQAYFEANSIDWSLFNTQWVDCFYLQVYKYHPNTDTWTRSHVWYVDPGAQTAGSSMGGEAEINTAKKNETSGEYEKLPGYRVDTETGEIITNPIEDVFGDFSDESDVGSYFEGLWNFFINGFKALASGLGQLPEMIGSVVSFLPPSVITLIGVAIVVCIILRIVGR